MNWLDLKVKWNPILQVYLASQIELFTAVLIQLLNWNQGDLNGDIAAQICTIVVLVGSLVLSLFVERVITVYHTKDLY